MAVLSAAAAAYKTAPLLVKLNGIFFVLGLPPVGVTFNALEIAIHKYRIRADSAGTPARMPKAAKHNIHPELEVYEFVRRCSSNDTDNEGWESNEKDGSVFAVNDHPLFPMSCSKLQLNISTTLPQGSVAYNTCSPNSSITSPICLPPSSMAFLTVSLGSATVIAM